MRIAAWAFVVCMFLGVVGLFVPAGDLDLGEGALTEPSSISVYQLSESKASVRRFLVGYRDSATRKVGARVLDKVSPYLPGRVRSQAADVQDTMATLDAIRDEDIETVGTITKVTMWSLLALQVAVGALLFGVTVRTSRLRLGAALVASLLAAALGVATHLVLRRVVAEANAEVGRELFALRVGAYLIPVAAVAAAGAVVAVVVAHTRQRRALA